MTVSESNVYFKLLSADGQSDAFSGPSYSSCGAVCGGRSVCESGSSQQSASLVSRLLQRPVTAAGSDWR